MRVAFFGSPVDAVPFLDALVESAVDVVMVVSQPDRRRGRGAKTSPSPVKAAAVAHDVDVLTPTRAAEVVDDVLGADIDLGVVVAFGQIIKPDLRVVLASLG